MSHVSTVNFVISIFKENAVYQGSLDTEYSSLGFSDQGYIRSSPFRFDSFWFSPVWFFKLLPLNVKLH